MSVLTRTRWVMLALLSGGLWWQAAQAETTPTPSAIETKTEAEDAFSAANTALFVRNHMQGLKAGDALVYSYQQTGQAVEAIDDTLTLTINEAASSQLEVHVNYLTGERNRWTPAFTNPKGNPLLLLFLQSDIYEMQRVVGGQWRHFQRYIKFALSDSARYETVTFDYAGNKHAGQLITIQPYLNDPENTKFADPAYSQKSYEFLVSESVPGGIFRIKTTVPRPDTANAATGATAETALVSRVIELRPMQ